jgi:hypothetical protein
MTEAEAAAAAMTLPPPKYKLPGTGPQSQGAYLLVQYLRDLDEARVDENGVLWVCDKKTLSAYMVPLEDFDTAYKLGWVDAEDVSHVVPTKTGLYWLDRFLRLNPIKLADVSLLRAVRSSSILRGVR